MADKADRVIRILIADDHAVVRRGLSALIETEEGMELVGEASDGEEAVRLARALHPDVILLDLVMPRKDGIAAIREIRAEDPEARILVLTSFAEDRKVLGAVEAGALGYLLKDATPQELLRALRNVHRGESSLNAAVARKLIHRLREPAERGGGAGLTERELAVLRLLARGLANKEIAARLFVSEPTVRTHVSSILLKLDVPNRTQAALYALREGLVASESESEDEPPPVATER
jgi:NarL family two-component system response regulator LiaR